MRALVVSSDHVAIEALRRETAALGVCLIAETGVAVASGEGMRPAPDLVAVDCSLEGAVNDRLLDRLEVLRPRPALILLRQGVDLAPRWFGFPRLLVLPTFPDARMLASVIAVAAVDPCECATERFAAQFRLSRTERQVVKLAVHGLHAKAIAAHLRRSPGTVDSHWKRILRKSGRGDRGSVITEILIAAARGSSFRQPRERDVDPVVQP